VSVYRVLTKIRELIYTLRFCNYFGFTVIFRICRQFRRKTRWDRRRERMASY